MPSESPKVAKPYYPTAKPARPLPVLVPEVIAPVTPLEGEEVEVPWLTDEMLKGWASSLVLHAMLLLCLAFWYFAPKVNSARVFDTRLAGSERGVEEGLTSTGGLNTALTMPEATAPSLDLPDPV